MRSFNLSYKSSSTQITFDSTEQSVSSLLQAIYPELSTDTHNIKLLVPGRRALALVGGQTSQLTLQDVGIAEGSKVIMLATSISDTIKLDSDLKANSRMRGFDSELKRELMRNGIEGGPARRKRAHKMPQSPPPQSHFNDYKAWTPEGLILHPPPSEALALLYALASDPGIVAVMKEKGWEVGMLTEMPPEGKVGISPVCILGLNVNAGQEIQLRLRTDDLKGFRKYQAIRDTLCHELAHNVHGDHDGRFKALNSEIKQKVDGISGAKRSLLADGSSFDLGSNQNHWSFLGDEEEDSDGLRKLMEETAKLSGRALGGHEKRMPLTPTEAAAEAAMRRSLAQLGYAAEDGDDGYEREDEGTRRSEELVKELEQ